MNTKGIRTLRRIFLALSILLGVFSPLFFLYKFPDFNPVIEPISTFGIKESTYLFWDFTIIVLAVAIFLNSKQAIKHHFRKKNVRLFLNLLVIVSSIALSFVAIISMKMNEPLHQAAAFTYFLVYNFYVFIFGLLRMYKDLRKGFFSVIMGCLMLLSTLLIIPFESYGVFEIFYVALVLFWNIVIFIKRIRRIG